MLVRELIEKLYGFNPNSEVKICSDSDTSEYSINCIESGLQDMEAVIYFSEIERN